MLGPTKERLLQVVEVARLTGLTRGRVIQLLLAKHMRGQKVGPFWLIPESEAKRFVDRPSKVGRPRSGIPQPLE